VNTLSKGFRVLAIKRVLEF